MRHTLAIRTLSALLGLFLLLGASACTPAGDTTDTSAPATEGDTLAESRPPQNETTAEAPADTPAETTTETEPETEEVLDMDAVIDRLNASPYASPFRTDAACGIPDPSLVGIREAAMTEVKYPLPADSEFAHLYNVTEYGITTDGTENARKFNALMAELASVEGRKKVYFPAGVYPMEATLRIDGVDDLYICSDGPGTNFELSMTAWCQGISVSACRNLHLHDLAFDYATPTAVSGEVVAANAGARTVTVRIFDEFDLTDPRYNGGKINWGSYMEFKEDKATGKYVPNPTGNLLYNSTGDGIKNIQNGTYDPATRELTLTFASLGRTPKEGTRVNVAYTMYEYYGLYAEDCEELYIEGARFYHTAGMTFGARATKNIYINRFVLSPREGSSRLMTATADGMHFYSCEGKVLISGSVLEYSHDDCLNIKGAYQRAVSNEGSRIIVDATTDIHVEPGDQIDIYDKSTFRYVGTYTVTVADMSIGIYEVAEPIEETLNTNYMICNASKSPALTIQNSYFGNKRNRGMLIQCREVLIENCTYQNIVHGAIQILSVADVFAEGIMPRNVTVRGCKFLGNTLTDVNVFTWGPQGTTTGTITGVTVEACFFGDCGAEPVTFLGAGSCAVKNNLIDECRARIAVKATTSDHITVTGNSVRLRRPSGFRMILADATSAHIIAEDNLLCGEPAEEQSHNPD